MASMRSPSTWKSVIQRTALSMNVRRTRSLPASAKFRPSPHGVWYVSVKYGAYLDSTAPSGPMWL